jgi:hypothetical protein
MERRSFLKGLFTGVAALAAPKAVTAAPVPTEEPVPTIKVPKIAKAAYLNTAIGGQRTLLKHNLRGPFLMGMAANRKGKLFPLTVEPVSLSEAWVTVEESRWKFKKGEPYSVCLYLPRI